MVDITQITEGAAAFKTALDGLNVLKGLRGVSGDKVAEAKISELQRLILSAQEYALSSQVNQFALVQEVGTLKEKISNFESWGHERIRYQLIDVNPGRAPVFAWALKAEAANGEPFHVLCAKCFEHRRKSILQATTEIRMRQRVHVCMECRSEYTFGHLAPPAPPAQAISEYDPFKEM